MPTNGARGGGGRPLRIPDQDAAACRRTDAMVPRQNVPPRNEGHAEAGVSLIELMLVLAAAAAFISALLSGVVALGSDRHVREERLLAFDACTNVLENLRQTPIAQLPAANGRGFAVVGLNGTGVGLHAVPGDADGLPGRITVQTERTYGTEVLYRVIVAVDWTGASPNGHVHFTTLMGRRR